MEIINDTGGQPEFYSDKSRIERDILDQVEADLAADPLNTHNRVYKNTDTPPYETDDHDQARAVREYLEESGARPNTSLIKYIAARKTFAAFDKQRGVYLSGEYALSALWLVVERLARARTDTAMLDRDEAERALRFGVKMMGKKNGQYIIDLLKEKELVCRPEEFDQNPVEINCQGLVVNMETGKRRKAVPADMFMKTAACQPLKIETPVFDEFIKEITLDREELAAWIMRYCGYALTGITREQFFANFYGGGGNGKGTLIHLLQRIIGDYAVELPVKSVVLERNEVKRDFDLANLPGRRLAIISDAPKNTRYNVENVKKITGEDVLTAEQKYEKAYQFTSVAKLIVSSNDKIILPSTGEDMRRRVRLVPFDLQLKEDEKDKRLQEKLLKEAPGILEKLLREAEAYISGGFPECALINDATNCYFLEQDTVAQFTEACITSGNGVQAGKLYAAYKAWCAENGAKEKGGRTFGEELGHQFPKKKVSGIYIYQGIDLIS
jgi:putative DNA primase/helicase